MDKDIFDRTNGTKELVFPGTRIAVAEEFIPGSGTYSTEDYIFSSVIGHVMINMDKHEISVIPKPTPAIMPNEGDIFIGSIVNISRQMVTVSINYLNKKEVYPNYTLVIHVSQVSREYLESAEDVLRLGDIIRGKIIDAKTIPLQGSLIGSQLGVILTHCSKCGERLGKIGRNKLKCPACSNIEFRKTTIDYGSDNLVLKI
ncbi:MAG: exosome complex RNA-binding protein Csl4 [Candidatus Heimdallarchaeaceae archaeon]